ncbi:rhodanese-like domain-containing protein [Chitinimonas lacunae]|uniref:Rhodanese-like domain-containing protein n=1 Tax=Chitinimonas lacunae TaxID=1963018 RepID=A0ABV8MQP5_9NEIS
MEVLTPTELAAWLADASRPRPLLLDVREPWEFDRCRIDGAINVPMQTIPERMQELDEAAPIVAICHHGMRSYQVASYLERAGFETLYNLSGGVAAWADQVDPAMPRY